MSNEELVALIQGGERERMAELWAQVEKFVAMMARRRLVLSDGLAGVEFDDLYNAGYLALLAAVGNYNPDAGRSFVSWLALALKTAFAEAGGYRSHRRAHDPLHYAGSLDEIAVAAGVHKETVRQWQNKALRALCKERRMLAQFIECRTPYYRNWSAQSGERTTEMIVLKREKLVEEHTERKRLDRAHMEGIMAIMSEADIDRIEDPFVRLPLRLHILHRLSWQEVASAIGAGRSASAVQDAYCRYLDRHPLDQSAALYGAD